MKVIYISGPYRGATPFDVHRNILKAAEISIKVWEIGAVALCPHLNTYLFEFYAKHIDNNTWINGDIELVKRCNAVLAIDGWEYSEGSQQEIDVAFEHRIPIFYTIEDLKKWLSSKLNGVINNNDP